jgi:hypothetical protein
MCSFLGQMSGLASPNQGSRADGNRKRGFRALTAISVRRHKEKSGRVAS